MIKLPLINEDDNNKRRSKKCHPSSGGHMRLLYTSSHGEVLLRNVYTTKPTHLFPNNSFFSSLLAIFFLYRPCLYFAIPFYRNHPKPNPPLHTIEKHNQSSPLLSNLRLDLERRLSERSETRSELVKRGGRRWFRAKRNRKTYAVGDGRKEKSDLNR